MNFEPGNYYGGLTAAIVGVSSKQNPQMVLTFNVTHVSANGAWQEIEPTDRRVYLSMTSAAMQYTQEKLVRMGFNDNLAVPEFTVKDCELVCRHETFEGKTREKWDLTGNGPAEVQQAPGDVIRKLQAQWNAKKGGVMRPSTTKPTPAPVAATPAAELGNGPAETPEIMPWASVINLAAAKGMTQDQLKDALKATGLQGYDANRDTAVVRQVVDAFMPAAPTGDEIPFSCAPGI